MAFFWTLSLGCLFLLPGPKYNVRNVRNATLHLNGSTFFVGLLLIYLWIFPLASVSPKLIARLWPMVANILLWSSWLLAIVSNVFVLIRSLGPQALFFGVRKLSTFSINFFVFVANRFAHGIWLLCLVGILMLVAPTGYSSTLIITCFH